MADAAAAAPPPTLPDTPRDPSTLPSPATPTTPPIPPVSPTTPSCPAKCISFPPSPMTRHPSNRKLLPPAHRKLIHPKSQWRSELLLPAAKPVIQLEVMTGTQVMWLLVIYYVLAFGSLIVIAWDDTIVPSKTSIMTCTQSNCSNASHTIYISPFCLSMTLSAASTEPLPETHNISGRVYLTVKDDFDQSIPLLDWNISETNHDLSAPPLKIDYGTSFGVSVDVYSVLAVYVEVNASSIVNQTPATTLTFAWTLEYDAPYTSLYICSLMTLLDFMCCVYFVRRVWHFRVTHPKVSLPQWQWINALFLSLFLEIQLPFTIAQYIYTTRNDVLPADFLQVSFWMYILGRNGSAFIVLCFADGMALLEQPPALSFYSVKAMAIAALITLQAVNYEGTGFSKSTNEIIVNLISTLQFCTSCLMVLYFWTRQGHRIRQFPYKSATFQYVTYGVMSFLVVPVTFETSYYLLMRVLDQAPAPATQILSSLASVIRVQAFAWMVLKCYLPLDHFQLAGAAAHARIPYKLHAKDDRPHVFCLETALVMLNSTATSYFDALDTVRSPSSCGRLGEHILHPRHHGLELVQAFHDPVTDTNALLLQEIATSRYILSFRGTGSLKNGLTDLKSRQVVLPEIDFKASQRHLAKRYHRRAVYVHVGFLQAYQTLQESIRAAIAALPRPQDGLPLRLCCTGHSLGGALATLCALDMALTQDDIAVMMYNFGSPRVGNHAFRLLFDSKVPAFRIVNDGDVVTQMPKRDYTGVSRDGIGIYKHVGKEVTLLTPHKSKAFRGIVIAPTVVDRVFVLNMRTKLNRHGMDSYRRSFRSLLRHEVSFEDGVTETGVEVSMDEEEDDKDISEVEILVERTEDAVEPPR
ncbi:unnamed protein product [Aphanomyces euteiches]